MTVTDVSDQVYRLVLNLLANKPNPTQQQIKQAVEATIQLLQMTGTTVDINVENLTRHIEASFDVWIASASVIEDSQTHIEWLGQRKADIPWSFWDRYQLYLEEVKKLPPASIRKLDEVTDAVLKRLEDPNRSGAWDRRGMVVGQVQSGKTSHYTGLICKAADAGYRLIVVLAGLHDNLRSQTQGRLDEGFLGFDTQQRMAYDAKNSRIGVGSLPGIKFLVAHSLTSSLEKGDFKLNVAKGANIVPGGRDPFLLVVKKNTSILKNLIKWATLIRQQTDPNSGRAMVSGVPLLVIDDEADNASINTNDVLDENGAVQEDYDPTKINGYIRKLLHSFEQKAYVGYTATPFANIFIHKNASTAEYGDDLFPRSFIINLPAPSNYVGPVQVFGLAPDDEDTVTRTGLPIMEKVDDYASWVPDKHKKRLIPGEMPQSMINAIYSFILACAAREARGQRKVHNSMLVHVTRFVDVQQHVAQQIRDAVTIIQRRLRYGDGERIDSILIEFQRLWEIFEQRYDKFSDPVLTPVSWEDIRLLLARAAAKIEVRQINGSAKDVLAYSEYPDGLNCIAVGGDKLSRGLTLEGLTVSYYLRATRMYDTLMQMGRWFGYRDGYVDLCRLYTTEELIGWYRSITDANEELRREFDYMAAMGSTPDEFGLRVRSHPAGLLVTAATKMRNGLSVQLTYAKTISETIVFHKDTAIIDANFTLTDTFLNSLGSKEVGAPSTKTSMPMWRCSDPDKVISFLKEFQTHPAAHKVKTSVISKYIMSRVAEGELTEWVIGLASGEGPTKVTIGGQIIDLVKRAAHGEGGNDDSSFRIRRLISPVDEAIDLTLEERTTALNKTIQEWNINKESSRRKTSPEFPSGLAIREHRAPQRGLLLLYPLNPEEAGLSGNPLIGLAISFPNSQKAGTISYVVNNTYWEQEFGDDE